MPSLSPILTLVAANGMQAAVVPGNTFITNIFPFLVIIISSKSSTLFLLKVSFPKKLTLKLSEVFHLQSTWKESSSIIPSYFGPFDSYCIPWGQISKETSWMHNSFCHFANIPWKKDWFGGDHLSQSQYEDIKQPRTFLNIFRHYWYENQFW